MTQEIPTNSIFSPGDVLLGRYEIITHLGSGGMGAVYRALDKERAKDVALKTFSADPKENQRAIQRFKNEFAVMQSLTHPNIVQAYDLKELEDQRLFIAMELLEGVDLDTLIHAQGFDSSFETKLELLYQIAKGLHYAHAQGLVHRDLKPANVFVTPEGEAKLLDFGLARQVAAGEANLTQSSERIGTAYYMSPEQHRGEDLDARSDIYSFGILAYELFSGRRPFDGDTPFQIFVAHVAQEIPSLRSEFKNFPKWLDTLIAIATEKDPKHRYPDMQQILDLIDSKIHADTSPGFLSRLFGKK